VVLPKLRNPATRENLLLKLKPPLIEGVGSIGELVMSTLFCFFSKNLALRGKS
jgi:hypothetical protein